MWLKRLSAWAVNAFDYWELEIAIKYLRNRRKNGGIAVISILSFIGIFLSVTSLITITSAMRGLQAHQMESFFTFKYHMIASFPKAVSGAGHTVAYGELGKIPGVVQASPFIERPALVQGPRATTSVAVRGLGSDAYVSRAALQRKLIAGDLGLLSERSDCVRCIVVGERLAQSLEVMPGDAVTLVSPEAHSQSYRVSGIFKSSDPKADAGNVFLSLDDAQQLFLSGAEWDGVGIVLEDPYKPEGVAAAIKEALGGNAVVSSWKQTDSSLWDALNIERVAMQIILYFVVLISALNIIAGLTMLVKNKTRDIGILRTMGCSRMAITRVFFMCGIIIGGLATCAGFVIGLLIVRYIGPIQFFLDDVFHIRFFGYSDIGGELIYVPAQLNMVEALTIFVLSLVLSAVCTLFPAISAAKSDPVAAVADG